MRKTVILLTGSAGFIGSNLARNFLNQKKKVVGIDSLQLGKIANIKNILKKKFFFF
jgi:nucleoside-diphosphate-sugar epimerase